MLFFEKMFQDVHYAIRSFRRTPAFTLTAVLSLALGLAANAALFSLIHSLLLRPLPYSNAERLVRLSSIYPSAAIPFFEQRSRLMRTAAAGTPILANVTLNNHILRTAVSQTSANFLTVLGVVPQRGRAFQPGDDSATRHRIALISDSLWRQALHANPTAVGRILSIDGEPYQIVGILPATFAYPSPAVQIWTPLPIDPSNFETYWAGPFTPLIGVLNSHTTIAAATTETEQLTEAFRRTFPYPMSRDWNPSPTATPLREDLVSSIKPTLLILTAAVAALLLLVCANVAGLLLSRSTSRRKEIALRLSLGATRHRLMRQLLTESAALSIAAVCLGLVAAWVALSAFKGILPTATPGLAEAHIDAQVAIATSFLSLLCSLAFGLVPALNASSDALSNVIKTGSQRSTSGFWVRFRAALIATEVAITFVLIAASGLLFRSLQSITQADLGFSTARVFTLRINPNPDTCLNRASCVAFYKAILDRAATLPGIEHAALANSAPLDGQLPAVPLELEDHPKTADHPAPMAWLGAVTPDYFDLLAIHFLVGNPREFSTASPTTPVALISVSLAHRFWPHESAIGKHLMVSGANHWRTIIGVVADVHQTGIAKPLPEWMAGAVYMPYDQSELAANRMPTSMTLFIRSVTSNAPARALESLIAEQAPNTSLESTLPLAETVFLASSGSRALLRLFSFFAATALVLAITGIYGLMSYWVSQRSYEIALRAAIGAAPRQILSLVLGQGLQISAYGLAVGIFMAFITTRLLSSLLYQVKPADIVTFAVTSFVLLVTSLLATAIPALSALRINPVNALKRE